MFYGEMVSSSTDTKEKRDKIFPSFIDLVALF